MLSPQIIAPVAGTGKAEYKNSVLGKGLPASPGAAVGRIVFTADEAEKWHQEGEKVGRAGAVPARVYVVWQLRWAGDLRHGCRAV